MTGLTAGATYKFKVAAINSVGPSTFSSEILITTTAATVPDPPTALTEIVASKTLTSVSF
jgi:titin